MVNYAKLGYSSYQNYLIDFYKSLMLTNHTFDFFVDWEKIYKNLEDSIFEVSLLNSLSKINEEDIESKFKELIREYPKVVPILPLILAIRNKKVPIFDINNKSSKEISFKIDSFDEDDIITFCRDTELLKLFNNIKDLYSYLLGVEVGLDSNARKNRSGHIFEDIVEDLLNDKIDNKPEYSIVKEDSNIPIHRNKRFDFVIYKNQNPIIAFECNFYNSTGSKPIEVAHAYVDLQKELNEMNIKFIWVTDGQGWKKMQTTLRNVSKDIEFIVNYNILNKIFFKFLESK